MKKKDERTCPNSCWNKANEDEWMFVLLGRDAASIAAVRAWISARIRLGKNQPNDQKIQNAQEWINAVVKELHLCRICLGSGWMDQITIGEPEGGGCPRQIPCLCQRKEAVDFAGEA